MTKFKHFEHKFRPPVRACLMYSLYIYSTNYYHYYHYQTELLLVVKLGRKIIHQSNARRCKTTE